MKRRVVGVLFLLLLVGILSAQTLSVIREKYFFIVDTLNRIQNNDALAHFYNELLKLEQGENIKVSVLHIGDSHIQGDFLPKKIRHSLQYRFGNGGRGLIFPLKLAKTNEPLDYKILSNVDWTKKKNLTLSNPLPIGICGYTLRSDCDTAKLKLMLLEKDSIEYCFNRFTLIHQKGDSCFGIVFRDGENRFISKEEPDLAGLNYWATTIETDSLLKDLIIEANKTTQEQRMIQLYGLILENEKPGIVHSMVGVNGAEFYHYNRSQYFFEQLSVLEPDLIIVSLGTNDALEKNFSKERFEREMQIFYKKIREVCPESSLLFTTPNDCSRKKIPSENSIEVSNSIINFANSNNVAYWDFYSIMGGKGSINTWQKHGLALSDHIHFNKKGYELQGQLLFNALMDGYRLFKNRF